MSDLRADMSPSVGKLGEALAKAQGVMQGAKKDETNPFFKAKYADLASVWEAIRIPLSANGLSIVQQYDGAPTEVTVITTLLHSSGEWIRSVLRMVPTKNDPQGIGSCATYARRYALSAIVGVSPEDDDGNAASQRPLEKKFYASPPSVAPQIAEKTSSPEEGIQFATKDEIDRIRDGFRKTGLKSLEITAAIETTIGKKKTQEWTRKDVLSLIEFLGESYSPPKHGGEPGESK